METYACVFIVNIAVACKPTASIRTIINEDGDDEGDGDNEDENHR